MVAQLQPFHDLVCFEYQVKFLRNFEKPVSGGGGGCIDADPCEKRFTVRDLRRKLSQGLLTSHQIFLENE